MDAERPVSPRRRLHYPIYRAIRDAIRGYPLDIGLIKELLQNADDAGASILELIVDWRHHPMSGLVDPRWKSLAGPALLAFNNRPFDERDLAGIAEYGEGSKRDSAGKTGRFGLGFSSVYNLTDHPCFVTGKVLICFDPAESLFEDGGYERTLDDLWLTDPEVLRPFQVCGLAQGQAFHDAVTFRFPFRTPNTAASSKISKEVFTHAHLHEITGQLRKEGSQLLVFLRHVAILRLSVYEPNEEKPRVLFEVSRNSLEPLDELGSLVHEQLKDKLPERLREWEEVAGHLPQGSWIQSFDVRTPEQRSHEEWLIVAGLFDRPGRPLVRHARTMLENDEKAIPWAGACVRLERGSGTTRAVPVEGRWYCSLPLPAATGLPVHLNGFFDLDRERRGLTVNQTAVTERDRARSRWNELLLEIAVTKAYGRLLQQIKQFANSDDADWYYHLWPHLGTSSDPSVSTLERHFYAYASDPKLIRVRECLPADAGGLLERTEARWVAARSIRLPTASAEGPLKDALILEGFPQPTPNLPPHVIHGLQTSKGLGGALTPTELAQRMAAEEDVDCPLPSAPRLSCRSRERVEALVRFIADKDPALLARLPLAILGDGHLHTFARTANANGWIFQGPPELLRLFTGWWNSIYVDPEFAKATRLERIRLPIREAKVGGLDAPTAFGLLARHFVLSQPSESYSLDSELHCGLRLTTAWLSWLLDAAVAAGNGKELRSRLERLPVIPDRDTRLHFGFSAATPLQLPIADPPTGLLWSLRQLGIAVLGSPLEEPVRSADRAIPGLCSPLNAERLVSALTATSGNWNDRPSALERRTFTPILRYLAATNLQSPLGQNVLHALRKLPVLPVASGRPVSADTPQLFRPTDFQPPAIKTQVVLVEKQSFEGWERLLNALGVQHLTGVAFISQVLRGATASLEPEERISVLRWLRDAHATLSKSGKEWESARHVLAGLPVVPCSGKVFRTPAEVHDLGDNALRLALGEAFCPADYGALAGSVEDWKPILLEIGIRTRASAEQVLERLEALSRRAQAEGVPAIRSEIRSLLAYLERDWSHLRAEKPKARAGATLMELLRTMRWLPAVVQDSDISEAVGFSRPRDTLYAPGELAIPALALLASSQCPILGYEASSLKFLEDIGVRTTVPLELATKHFLRVIEVWSELEPSDRSRRSSAFEQASEEFYQFADRVLAGGDRAQFERRFGSTACIWHGATASFRSPLDVFAGGIRGFEPRWVTRPFSPVLVALGCQEEPDARARLRLLRSLDVEFSGRVLDEMSFGQARHLLLMLEEELKELSENVPLLTSDGRLAVARRVWRNDASWLGDRVSSRGVQVVNDCVPPAVVKACRVRRLSESLREELAHEIVRTSESEAIERVFEIERRLRSPEFRTGLRRILLSQSIEVSELDLKWLDQLRVVAVDRVVVRAYIEDDKRIDLGELASSHYVDRMRGVLFIESLALESPAFELARVIDERLALPDSLNLAPVEAILSRAPEDMDAELERRRIPALDAAADTSIRGVEKIDPRFCDDPDDESSRQEAPPEVPEELPSFTADPRPDDSQFHTHGFSGRFSIESDREERLNRPDDDSSSGPPVNPGFGFRTTSSTARPGGGAVEDDWKDDLPQNPASIEDDAIFTEESSRTSHGVRTQAVIVQGPFARESAIAAHRAGVELVVSYEHEQGRSATPLAVESGLDLESGDRVIKVIAAAPRVGYQSITVGTLYALRDRGEHAWVYFVESSAPGGPRILALKDPAERMVALRLQLNWTPPTFDEEWPAPQRAVGVISTVEVAVGATLILDDGSEAVVEAIDDSNLMKVAKVRYADGEHDEVAIHPGIRVK